MINTEHCITTRCVQNSFNSLKRVCLLLLFLIVSCMVPAQDINRNVEIMKNVMASDKYLHAYSSSDSLDLAIADAVKMLSDQVLIEVKTTSKSEVNVQINNGELDEKVLFNQVSETFSNVRLSGYQTLIVAKPSKKNKEYSVFVYIGKAEVKEILKEIEEQEKEKQQKEKEKNEKDVSFYYSEGRKAIKDARVGDALKYLYWSYVLSLGTNVTIGIEGKEVPATRLIETQIDKVLNGISVEAVSYETERINDFQEKYKVVLDIVFNYDGIKKRATNLDFEYNDGNTKQRGPRVRDGVGTLDLQYNLDEVKFQCIYKYDSSETPPDIYDIIKNKGNKKFESATKIIRIPKSLKDNPVPNQPKKEDVSEGEKKIEAVSTAVRDHNEMQRRMGRIVKAIKGKDYESVEDLFSAEGFDSFKKLIKLGNASIVRVPNEFRFLDFGNLTLCRCITMQFRFRNNKQFVEDVTFRFNDQNIVESLAFTLSDVAENDILSKGKWPRDSRLTLMTFLEDYQTAYALGRIDYLERIFSENALIIVGNKVEKKILKDGVVIKENVKYDTVSKAQYIDRLRRHFRTKEYINLNFTDTDFERASNKKEFYGIRVRQEYFSNNYGDVGWLFLLVDLRYDEPIIHVRAWQNDKLPMEDLFDLSDCY